MSRRQIALVILVNAFLSLVISLGVVWLALTQWQPRQVALSPLTVPTGRPLATPPKTDLQYIVQQGDSLSSIAVRFGVPIADLMRANDLSDPDHISVGQRLLIPAGPVPETTATPTLTPIPFAPPTAGAAPSATPTSPRATRTAEAAPVKIGSISFAGDIAGEALVIANSGQEAVELDGWTLSDATALRFTFPALTLPAGKSVKVHSGAGGNSVTDLYAGLTTALWQKGATAVLKDRNGEVVSRFNVE